jgi:hypothetical protein
MRFQDIDSGAGYRLKVRIKNPVNGNSKLLPKFQLTKVKLITKFPQPGSFRVTDYSAMPCMTCNQYPFFPHFSLSLPLRQVKRIQFCEKSDPVIFHIDRFNQLFLSSSQYRFGRNEATGATRYPKPIRGSCFSRCGGHQTGCTAFFQINCYRLSGQIG